MTTDPQQFPVSMRFFHWLVAAMVLTMLGIGVTMVASLAHYHAGAIIFRVHDVGPQAQALRAAAAISPPV